MTSSARARWYLARLRAMSGAELAYRLSQTVRRAARRLRVGPRASGPAALASIAAPGAITQHRIAFFDLELPYPSPEGIDWRRDYKSGRVAESIFYGDLALRDPDRVGDLKYTWELNRHQFLVPWALAYRESGDEGHARAVLGVISDWIAANPRYLGVNWASSLELALRLLSWGIALDLCSASEPVRQARAGIAVSVSDQAGLLRRSLSLYSSANNHLIGELVGLLAVAVFFPEVRGTASYSSFARRRLLQEAHRQSHPDGVNREQAIYYHHYTLEYLITACVFFRRLGWRVPSELLHVIHRMLEFVDAMTDEAGEPFEVGDRDDGFVTGLNLETGTGVFESLLVSGWLLFGDVALGEHAARIAVGRGGAPAVDKRNAYWFGQQTTPLPPARPLPRRRWFFPEGGYFISRDQSWSLMFKGGPFGYPAIAAHAHCDQLSVGLKAGSVTVLNDAGTGVYHTDERWRRYFRSTSAHNTVRVDGQDQAEYAGPFLWATHAWARLRVLEDRQEWFEVQGEHDGYRRLRDPVRHQRAIAYREGHGYRVTDHLYGRRSHTFELFWNLGWGLRLERLSLPPREQGEWVDVQAGWRVLLEEHLLCTMLVASDVSCEIAERCGDDSIPAGFESRRYLEWHPVQQICVTSQAPGCRFTTYILPPPYGDDLAAAREGWS